MNTAYSQIFKAASKYLALRNVFLVISIGCGILIVRSLGPAQYGKWSLIWQIISTVAPLLSLGFLPTLSKFVPEIAEPEKKRELFALCSFWFLCIFTLLAVFSFLISIFFPNLFPQEIYTLRSAFFIFAGISAFLNLFEGYYRGLGKFNFWTAFDGVRSVVSTLCAVGLVWFLGRDSYQNVFYSYFITGFVFLGVLIFLNYGALRFPSSLKLDRKIVNFSLISIGGQIVFAACFMVDPILIRSLLKDSAQVGLYDVGVRIPRLLETVLISPLSVPFLYYFSQKKTDGELASIVRFGTRMMLLSFACVSLVLFSFADFIIPLLFSDAYVASASVLKIYAFVPFFISCQVLSSTLLVAKNRPLVGNILSFLAFCLIFSLDLLLIPHFKLLGVAVASLCGNIFVTLGIALLVRAYDIHLFKLLFRFLFGIGISIIVGTFILKFSAPIIFVIYAFLIGLFSKEDIQKIWLLIQHKDVSV